MNRTLPLWLSYWALTICDFVGYLFTDAFGTGQEGYVEKFFWFPGCEMVTQKRKKEISGKKHLAIVKSTG
jgi:hypothetical protein